MEITSDVFTGGIKIEWVDEIKLSGISKQFKGNAQERFSQEHSMWSDHHDYIQELTCKTAENTWYGIWDNSKYSIAKKDKDVCNLNLETIIIPSGKYAMFSTEFGGYAGDELPKLRKKIFSCWLADSGYEQTHDYEVEVYHLSPKGDEHKRYYEIWIPIR